MIKKLEATESEANNQRNDATDEAFNFKKVAGPDSDKLTEAQQKDKKLRAEREVEPSQAHLTSGEDFYHDRKTDLEMLDGHKAFLEKDPAHSISILKRWPVGKTGTDLAVLEVGTGQARVTVSVLMQDFKIIDIIEPGENLRNAAIERMKELGQPYRNRFPGLIQDF